jgi:MoaA/NifB/PqqE/SkfB family radical SAM enzyme
MNKYFKKIRQYYGYCRDAAIDPPEFVSLVITHHCNFSCKACTLWLKNENEMAEDYWMSVVDQLAKFSSKSIFVEINGGEPLLKTDLVLWILEALSRQGLAVTLNSNGFLLDEKRAQKLAAAGLKKVKISLYSKDAQVHDALRGKTGAHAAALAAVERVLSFGMEVEIGILLTGYNCAGLPDFIRWMEDKHPSVKVILQPLDEIIGCQERSNFLVNNLPSELWPKGEDSEKFFQWLFTANISNIKNSLVNLVAIRSYYQNPQSVLGRNCLAGQRSLVIYPDGGAAYCFKGIKVGNVREDSLKEIWYNKGKKARKQIKHCRKFCRIVGCNFSKKMIEYLK